MEFVETSVLIPKSDGFHADEQRVENASTTTLSSSSQQQSKQYRKSLAEQLKENKEAKDAEWKATHNP